MTLVYTHSGELIGQLAGAVSAGTGSIMVLTRHGYGVVDRSQVILVEAK